MDFDVLVVVSSYCNSLEHVIVVVFLLLRRGGDAVS